MSSDLEKAAELLKTGRYTFAAVSGEKEITSVHRGVKPLLELLDCGEKLHGFSAADKVIGKAAAFIYVLLKPDEVYAGVISRPALEVLEKYGIRTSFGTLAEAIRNRQNTGFCPMETAVKNANSPDDALALIRKNSCRNFKPQ
ncbi:MAG: DUF1893 domain-containing protein [Ruminococcus sp.]|nr:DUF1893 domain-containing protein [Ruminococcus sp.]